MAMTGVTDSRSVLLGTLTEAQWQKQVVALAKSLGWNVWHPQIAVWSKSGWPDLVLCKPPRALFWELKTEKGKVNPNQEHWLGLLKACGLDVAVVRPSDREWVHAQLMGKTA